MPCGGGLGLWMLFFEWVIMGWEEEWEGGVVEMVSGGWEFSGVWEFSRAVTGVWLERDYVYGSVLVVWVWGLGSMMGSVWRGVEAREAGSVWLEGAVLNRACWQSSGHGPRRDADWPEELIGCVGSGDVFWRKGKRFSRKITSLEI